MTRVSVVVLLIVGLGCGCKSTREKPAPTAPHKTIKTEVMEAPGSSRDRTRKPEVRPVDRLSGRVVAVRDTLRFVIVDFPARKLPKLEQKLVVYRLDQKVAEIKISGPFMGTSVAADIT